MKPTHMFSIALLLILAAAGCEPAPIVGPDPEEALLDSPETDVEFSDLLPVAAAGPVLAYLERERFREMWELWPGTAAEHPGAEPHGLMLTTYVNRLALEGIETRNGAMPVGAMIVKDNFSAEGDLVATTLMYKRAGEQSDPSGWFWMKWQPDNTIDAAGPVEGCRSCHGMAQGNDFILTAPIASPATD